MLGEVLQGIKTLYLGVFAIFTKQVLTDSVSGLLTITLCSISVTKKAQELIHFSNHLNQSGHPGLQTP